MARLALTPTLLLAGGSSPTNLTALFTALSANTGVSWTSNDGKELLVVSVGTSATTPTSNIPLLIQGEPVTGQSGGALTTSAISILGPYPSQFDSTDGTFTITVDFSVQTNVSVALLKIPGVS